MIVFAAYLVSSFINQSSLLTDFKNGSAKKNISNKVLSLYFSLPILCNMKQRKTFNNNL